MTRDLCAGLALGLALAGFAFATMDESLGASLLLASAGAGWIALIQRGTR